MKPRDRWAIAMLLLALAGCAPRVDGPPPLHFGERACTQCRMLVSDERFAVALVDADGAWRYFDGLGCAGAYRRGAAAPRQVWVRDFESPVWLDASAAVYIRSPDVEAPMGDGLLAVATAERAAALADRLHGQVIAAEIAWGQTQ